MRIHLGLCAAALVALAAAACSSGQPSNYIAPPAAGSAGPSAGLVSLSTQATTVSVGTVNGIQTVLTFGSGSGTLTSTAAAAPPTGIAAVTTSATQRIALASTIQATAPSVIYVTILSPSGATLTGLPGISLLLPAAATSSYQEAQYNGAKFVTVPGSTPALNSTSTSVTFPATASAVTIPPNGSIYLAFYQSGNPPPSGPNVLADSGFESGTAGAFGTAVNSTGWTQCAISASAAGVTPPHPYSNFTPVPNSTPAAVIAGTGTAVAQGTKTPAPTVTAVPAFNGKYAASIGALFNNFNAADFAYNGLCQALKMPSQPSAQMMVLANGTENDKTFFDLQVDVLDSTGKYLANLVDENQIQTSPPGDLGYRQIFIPQSALSPYAGQNVQLFVGMWTKAGSSTGATTFSGYYFVDDVQLFGIQ